MATTTTTMTTTTTTMGEISTTSTTASPPPPLVVMITGGGGVFTAGTSHSLTCTASGGASMIYTYQWLRYDGDIVGEKSSTISFSPLREVGVGRYSCRVSDGSMTTTSDGVVINVEGEYNGDTFIINNHYTNLYLKHCHYQLPSH